MRQYWVFLLLLVLPAAARDIGSIEVKMLAQGSALFEIDGKQRLLRDGNRSPEGLVLVAATPEGALVDFQGQRQLLKLNRRISAAFHDAAKAEVRIASGQGGHYVAPGRINGSPVEFMVDTGATSVSMSEQAARRLRIDYRAGRPMTVNTASGTAQAFGVMLDRVAVGEVEVHQVPALIIAGDAPAVILLGNSFLGRVDMQVEQGVMLLRSKH